MNILSKCCPILFIIMIYIASLALSWDSILLRDSLEALEVKAVDAAVIFEFYLLRSFLLEDFTESFSIFPIMLVFIKIARKAKKTQNADMVSDLVLFAAGAEHIRESIKETIMKGLRVRKVDDKDVIILDSIAFKGISHEFFSINVNVELAGKVWSLRDIKKEVEERYKDKLEDFRRKQFEAIVQELEKKLEKNRSRIRIFCFANRRVEALCRRS